MTDKGEYIIDMHDQEQLKNIFGKFDENIILIEESLGVKIDYVDNGLKITGDSQQVKNANKIVEKLKALSSKGEIIKPQIIKYILSIIINDEDDKLDNYLSDSLYVSAKGKLIKCKTHGQKVYADAIRNNTVTFGVGPAGTGKTYLAIAMAIYALKNKIVSRIVLTRPIIEAGEKLGYLPGDLQEKIDPYLRPMYDSLYNIIGQETCQKYIEKGLIEIAPLAYMRGRTLDESFIILDEAQNTTHEQMKMFLTRIGFGSKVVVTGDITQIDLPRVKLSGLVEAINVLKDINDISIVYLTNQDIVRHELIQKIILAYENNNKKDLEKNDLDKEKI